MNSLIKYAALLLALIVVTPAVKAGYPLPGKDTQAAVICTNCPGINFNGQSNKNLPTFPFSAPIVKHVGRLVDSSATKDVQNIGIRTIRAGRIRLQPTANPSRIYIKMGGAIGAYTLSTFFTNKLPAGMQPVTSVANVSNSRTKFNSPNEDLTVWDAYVYAEGYGGSWPVTPDDKQDVLHDMDADDRGFVYAAYSVWGWGILTDAGENGGSLLGVMGTNGNGASVITVVKVGSSYYVGVGENTGEAQNKHAIYNVTNPGSPALLGNRTFGIRSWAKNDAVSRIAILDHNKQLRIYDYQTFALGGAPLFGPVSAPGGFADVQIDETGNVWAVTALESFDASVRRFTPSGSTYTASTHAIGEVMKGNLITVAGGYLAVAGQGTTGSDVVLFKVEGTNLRRLDLKNFFLKYYHHAPLGYANPPTDFSYVAMAFGLKLVKQGNKLYLIYNAHGMGDVFEIEAGDSIGATMRTSNFGTANPNSKATVSGPFLGDVVKFVATSSNTSLAYQVSWDFGNPESGQNLAQTSTGTDVSHQFSGYTTPAAITAVKEVTATAINDASLTDKVNVTLKVPVPRIGIAGTPAVITAAGPAFNVLLGDSFTDASDGSVESHFTNWVIDGGTPTPQLPSQSISTGAIGPHTVTMATSYGRYDAGTFTPATSMYSPSVANVPYVVRPFMATINAAKTGANAVFSATSRVTANTQILAATQWTPTWTWKRGATVMGTQTSTVAIGTIPNYSVATASLSNGDVITLDLVVVPAQLVGPVEYATFSTSMLLETPSPTISKSGCANAGAPCTLTAGGTGMTDAVLSWTLTGPATLSGTGTTYSPNITVAGTYTVTLVAVKGIFEGTATTSLPVAAALCGPPPTSDQIAISHSCGGACEPGTAVTFKTSVFGYARQDCDVYTWSWGDGSANGTGETNVKHTYGSSGTFTVNLSISNTGGSPTILSYTITIGSGTPPPPPPPTCEKPTNVLIEYSGSGCQTGTPCKSGSSVKFIAYKNGGLSQLSSTCDTASWTFGDGGSGTGKSPSHTYANPGTYNVSVRVTSSGGSSTANLTVQIIQGDGGGSCSTAPTVDNLILDYRGASCSSVNGSLCQRSENIQFDVKTFGYTFQSCDKFEWNFGDGGTATTKNPTHAYTGNAASYRVSVRVYNTANPTGVTLTADVPFDNAPLEPTPTITVSGPTTAGKGGTVQFTAVSSLPATGWSWNFGDGSAKDNSQAGLVSQSSSVSHVFTKTGTFTVTVTAKNANDTTDRSTGTGLLTNVNVSETPVYKFLLPAVIHSPGQNGSSWRTDVQVYYSAPSPSAEPLNMTAEFNGSSTALAINQSTFIYEDFVGKLTTANASGSVILTTQTKYKPQIWTRTYSVDTNGATFGQFIPAIELTGTTAGTVDGSAEPLHYYLSGLRQDSRFRTNLGFINTTATDIIADVTAYDDLQTPLDRFAVTLTPFTLSQMSLSKVKGLSNRPVSLVIAVPAGKALVAYASLIDGASNDPVYISAISDVELSSADYGTSITPGVGHVGAWRSDVTIFNPDDRNPVTFDLRYFDGSGLQRGLATGITLGPLQSKNYEDLLRVSSLFSPAPPDGVGMLKLQTQSQQTRYPLTFSRTYNDKGTGGTFGQGIFGVAAVRANVKPNKPAIIAGVRSNSNYKTNIGLTNTSGVPVNVRVQLLDPNTGAVASEQSYSLVGDASVVGEYPFGALASGALRIEITSGSGSVWAFASVIDRQSEDPEYVPASPVQ